MKKFLLIFILSILLFSAYLPENLACFHGIDERVSVSEFEDGIRFYRQMILNGGSQ